MSVRGYKVFNPDWTCRGFRYKVGEVFEENYEPAICDRGFHFCEKAVDCFNYYTFDSNNKVAEIEALGDVVTEGVKSCTNKIKIVREVSWQEVLMLVNAGKGCTGNRNSGNCNSGDWNSGNRNSGNCNSGNCNSGDCNSGNRNSGNRNSGDWNSGNRNSGDWNSASYSNGCFNTEMPKISMFNKLSDWTYEDWLNSEARGILNTIPTISVGWIYLGNMTDEEKEAHPESKTTGGYLKTSNPSREVQDWWDALSEYNKEVIKSLPNFDKDIFKEITGVTV